MLNLLFLFSGAQACVLAFSTVDRDSFEAIESWKRKVESSQAVSSNDNVTRIVAIPQNQLFNIQCTLLVMLGSVQCYEAFY